MKRSLILGFIFFLTACSSSSNKEGKSISQLIDLGLKDLKKGDFSDAAASFKKIDSDYPYSSTAIISSILSAYAWYKSGGENYSKAVRELELFLKYNPSHEYVPYAMYLRGVCLIKQINKVGRTQENTLKARAAFVDLIQQFPDSKYAKDADKIIIKLDTSLAAHEMSVAKFYHFKQKNYIAAAERYMNVVQNYLYTNQAPEAMYRVIECYLSTGINSIAKDVYAELKRLFPNNIWTKKATSKFLEKLK